MLDLLEYFRTAFSENFVFGEYDETVQLLYKTLGGAIRLHADRLIITEDETVLQRQGEIVSSQQNSVTVQTAERPIVVRFRNLSAMNTILRHDSVVREHFHLVEQSPERVVYSIDAD